MKQGSDRFFIYTTCSIFLILPASPALAGDHSIVPRLSTGLLNFKYDREPNFTVTNETFDSDSGLEFSDTVPVITAGLTYSGDRFYLDLNFQQSVEAGTDTATVYFSTVEAGGAIDTGALDSEIEFDYEEAATTLGYFIADSTTLFAGYRRATTQFHANIVDVANTDSPNPLTLDVSGTNTTTQEFSGPFVGVNQIWPISLGKYSTSALSLKLTATSLRGRASIATKFRERLRSDPNQTEVSTDNTINSGSQIGLNIGLAWTGKLSNELNYSFAIDGYNYESESAGSISSIELVRYTIGFAVPLNL